MEGSMEEATIKEQSSAPPVSAVKTTTKLRYPLRSATTKSKEEKPSVTELTKSSASKRGRPPSSVAQSVSVLDLSGKNRSSAKPPRRLSVPSKTTPISHPRPVGNNISPISEANKTKRLFGSSQGKNGTPVSDYSRSYSTTTTIRGKNLLSSTSYWLSHIKQSESAAKHNISLGFFKLALEAGCEPIQKMRDELKSYARRHNIVVLGEGVAATGKELFERYNISEHFEQLQVSDSTSSQVPEDGRSRSSDDDVRSSSSIIITAGGRGGGAREVKTRSLKALTTSTTSSSKAAAAAAALSNEANKKDNNTVTKKNTSVSSYYYRKTAINKNGSGSEKGGNLDKSSSQMKKKPRRQEMEKGGGGGGAKEDDNATNEKKGEVDDDSSPTKKAVVLLQENKENLDGLQKMGELSLTTIQV